MAVAFDAVGPSSSGTNGGTSPLTWTHVNGASATLIMVGVAVDSNSDSGVTTTATYGGTSMTSLLRWESGGSTQHVGFVQVFYLLSPLTGSNTVSVASTTGFAGMSGGSVSFTGATALGTAVHADSNSAATTSGTIAVSTSSSSNMVFAAMCTGSGSIAFTAGTSRWVDPTGAGFAGAAAFSGGATAAGTGGSVSISWTETSDFYAAVGVEVQGGAAVTSGPSLYPEFMQRSPGAIVSSSGWRGANHSR